MTPGTTPRPSLAHFRRAAAAGDPRSAEILALMLRFGHPGGRIRKGVPADATEAGEMGRGGRRAARPRVGTRPWTRRIAQRTAPLTARVPSCSSTRRVRRKSRAGSSCCTSCHGKPCGPRPKRNGGTKAAVRVPRGVALSPAASASSRRRTLRTCPAPRR